MAGAGQMSSRVLVALARPRLLPFVVLLPLVGYGWAHWDRALTPQGGWDLPWVLAAWVLLHAGTLWLNAAADRDEGEVLLGRAVPVPDGIEAYAYAALAACAVLGWIADPVAGVAASLCAVLAVLYSHPATLWKGHPVLGPVVNGAGYGLLSTLAGFAVVDVGPTARSVAVWLLGMLGILGCYFAAQAFQEDEDRERGYRTLVVTHGPRGAVLAGRICIGAGFLAAVALAVAGWFPRVTLLAAPLGLWVDAWFVRWLAEPGGGGEVWARGMANRLFVAGLVVLVLVLGTYGDQVRRGVPVAGLATVAGHPHDRPLLPPRALRQWEMRERIRALHAEREAALADGSD